MKLQLEVSFLSSEAYLEQREIIFRRKVRIHLDIIQPYYRTANESVRYQYILYLSPFLPKAQIHPPSGQNITQSPSIFLEHYLQEHRYKAILVRLAQIFQKRGGTILTGLKLSEQILNTRLHDMRTKIVKTGFQE